VTVNYNWKYVCPRNTTGGVSNDCTITAVCWYYSCWRNNIVAYEPVNDLSPNAHYIDMSMISQYVFHITITNIKPKDQMLWVSYQYGPAITDFYATRIYDTTQGVGGLTTPQLSLSASVHSLRQGSLTELYFNI
jgi:hypothetical protein